MNTHVSRRKPGLEKRSHLGKQPRSSSKSSVSSLKIKENCEVEASVLTVQRAMSQLVLAYKKTAQKLRLTTSHKIEQVEFARNWIGDYLLSKNFSDKKRISFDGPDNWFSWYDPFDPPQRIKREMSGGGVMVWGMTLPSG